ncbi:tripartite motif-containing protein 16-like isoform X1 [Hemibagrus wyckioides]|uniref:tripartite motif-containing protein 16-like isoform X1 n=1 Tax=Hemibagrus wyckioides TaxID=337641 RepID=UPI00266D98BF|nr:tripartite motif-containing protein 16-like isoform X1 [Hemibagrus wyckioides]
MKQLSLQRKPDLSVIVVSLGPNPHPHHVFIPASGETKLARLALAKLSSSTNMDEKTVKSAHLSYTAPSDVECDVCTGRKRKAEQSCMECMASFCKNHLDLHNILHVGKRRKLVETTGSLKDSICPKHNKLMEIFCRKDQQCICNLCITNKHKNHDVVLIGEEVPEKKIKLGKMQRQTAKMIQTREKEEQALKQTIKSFKTSATKAVELNERSFTELIRSIEMRQCAVKEMILAQEEAVVKKVNTLLQRLEREISDLKSRDAELQHLEQLSQAENEVYFLQSASCVRQLSKLIQIPALSVHPSCPFQLSTDAVSNLIKKLHLICQWRFITISERVKNTGIVSAPLPETYQELLKYAIKLTLDTNTVHDNLQLSNMNKELTAVHTSADYPSHPDRFERRVQALCKEGLRGSPRYWEVECGTKGSWVNIAVSYKGIKRKGKQAALFGRCKSSWALRNYGGIYQFWHDNKWQKPHPDRSLDCTRIGIYLDHGAGILAFYNVSGNLSLITKVQTKFTEPVYAGFGLVGIGSHIRLCDL